MSLQSTLATQSLSVFLVQPHLPARPPPPQLCGATQVMSQSTVPPQPFEIMPQSPAPQVLGVHCAVPHLLAPPQPQVPLAQVPQLSVTPQPSGSMPQSAPAAAQLVGVQPHLPA